MYLPTGPTFLLPHRRYASISLLPLAREYLDQDRLSYQRAVAPQGRVIGYVTPPGEEKIDERALHRSTLWRFVRFLGGQAGGFQAGVKELSDEEDSRCAVHRFLGAAAPHKYRSPQRGETLRSARRLLRLIEQWNRAFAESFFPRFATRPRSP